MEPEVKNSKKAIIISIIIILLIAIIVAGTTFFIIYTKNKNMYNNLVIELKENKLDMKYGEELELEDYILKCEGGILEIEDNVNLEKPGEYKVIYKVVAENGSEKTKELEITITDDVAPVIILDTDTVTLKIDEEINLLDGVDVLDNCDSKIINELVITGEVDAKTPGTYEIKYDVTDSSGNSAETKIRTYIVKDIPTLEIGKTYEYKDSLGGSSYKLNKNGKVQAQAWATNAGGTEYRGTYEINEDKLTIKLTEMNDYIEWVPLEVPEITYTITGKNQFTSEDGTIFTMK